MADVFISYSRKDIAFARLLHKALKANGLETWIDWQDIPPSTDWLAEVYEAIEQAVAQLREVEAFFKDHAAEAALRIARLYQHAGKKKLCVAALRGVLKKYPESGQSSTAHQELERLGIKMGGGVDAH